MRRSHPRALLVIAGEGPATRHLRRLGEGLGLGDHLRFVGYRSREHDLPDCYAAGEVFVFASRTQTQGLVLLEAMQAGTPVVSTAIMGTAAVMADRRGGLVAADDVGDFAAKVGRLLDDRQLRSELRAQAVAQAAGWSAPATTERLLRLYQERIAAAMARDRAAAASCQWTSSLLPSKRSTSVVAEHLVVVARNEHHTGVVLGLAEDGVDHVVMRLRPVQAALHVPHVDDIADQVEGLASDRVQKIQQHLRATAAEAEVDVGYPCRAHPQRSQPADFHHR